MTRAKDISKIVTDADLSGTLDVTGTVTAGGLNSSVSRTSGANATAITLSDNVTGAQTSGFGTRIVGASNSNGAVSAIGFEADGGTNNDTAISLYTQPQAGTLRQRFKASRDGDISFYEDTGTTPKLFWQASTERLGIGTVSPSVALDVSGSNSILSRAAFTRTDTSSTLEAGAWFTSGPYIGSATNHPLQIITNDTERMRIDSSGNVGIGTSSPVSSIHAKGSASTGLYGNVVATFEDSSNNYPAVTFKGTSGELFAIRTPGSSGLVFADPSSGSFLERMRITSGGNVGIGDDNPNARLVVNVATNANLAVQNTGGALQLQGINDAKNAFTSIDIAGNPITFSPNSTEAMRIDANGNVGIGTTSAQGNLDVRNGTNQTVIIGNSGNYLGGEYGRLMFKEASSELAYLQWNGTGNEFRLMNRVGTLTFGTSNNEKMRIDTSGNVGVGTTNPLSRLHINNTSSAFYMGYGGNQDIYLQTTNGNIIFSDYNAANERMRIDSSGNVILSSNEPTLFLKDSNNTNTTRYIKNSAEIFTIGRINDDLSASSVEHLRIDDSGRLQVGLTNGESGINTISGLSWYRTSLYSQRWQSFISHGGTGEYGTLYFNGTLTTGDFVVQPGLTERMRLKYNGETYFTGVYSQTTASGANVNVLSTGLLRRSTSSLRYKNTVNDATHGLNELLTLRPVTYKGNSDGDTIFGGLIAEEVHDAGLTEFVQYNDDGEPDALAYGNMVSLCIKAIQELKAELDSAKARITALENGE